MSRSETLFLALGVVLGFAGAVSYSSRAQREDFAKEVQRPRQQLLAEVALGQCRYDRAAAGTWWQPDQENSNNFKDNSCRSARLGLRLNPVMTVYLGAVNLGRAHTRAMAVTTPGDDATKRDLSKDIRRAECRKAFNEDNCLYAWSGDGGAERSMQLTLGLQAPMSGPVVLEAEAGILLYRMSWTEQVCQTNCQGPEAWRVEVNQHTGYFVSPVVGARVRVNRCFGILPEQWECFGGGYYYARINDHLPITAGVGKTAQTWMGGVTVNF